MAEQSRVEPVSALFKSRLSVVNLGLASFAENLTAAGAEVVQVDWRPPAGGDAVVLDALDRIASGSTDVDAANQKAVKILLAAKPTLIDIGVAGEVVPGMTPTTVLHSGPPVTWDKMCGPMRGGVIGGLIYQGLAKDRAEAEALAASGEIAFKPCHSLGAVGPMAGVVTAKMPVWILENAAFGNRAFCTVNEGLGKVLRYGAFSEDVLARLRWIET